MVLRLPALSLFILFFGIGGTLAQTAARPGAPAQPGKSTAVGTVGVIAGDIDSTGLRVASDLSRLFDSGNELRVIPIVGKGSAQNINDLLTLKVVDIAIVQSDVMARFLKTNRQPGIQSRVQYVAKLYSEELHVLSRMQFLCLQDLAGRRVSFGPRDSGAAITAEAVFEASNIPIDPIYLDHQEAVERLKKGQLDALVYVGGKPSSAFDGITHKDKVHFLDVEYLPALQPSYLPAIITSEDYSNLVAPNESVATIGVSSVMAIHNWPPQSERFRVMTRFVEKFFGDFDKLKAGSFSPKWREVNIRAPVKGWQRFQPAERWLIADAQAKAQAKVQPIAPQAAQQLKTMLQRFVESQQGSSTDQEELFNQFVRWYQQQGAQAPQQQ
ncbi:MAG: TAXI family TRAP transporter solute-binding subunit [Rhodomicrobium sp.]